MKRSLLAVAVALGIAGCAGALAPSGISAPPSKAIARTTLVGTPLKHVVVVIQENRTFDNLFRGYPGSDYSDGGPTHTGKRIALRPITFTGANLRHNWGASMIEWDKGKMDGFDLIHATPTHGGAPLPPDYAYSYVERPLVRPYWKMAESYVLADHMFPTEMSDSFVAHQMLVAGTTSITPERSIVDLPSHDGNCDAPAGTTTSLITVKRRYLLHAGPFPCFTQYRTLADSLDAAKLPWKYYYPYVSGASVSLWNAFQAISKVRYGPDWANVVYSPTAILDDAKKGNLGAVSWVVPDFENSDHPSAGSDTGPSWVASIVNAIGKGPDWNTTAIVVVWDDWGGWYDSVPPPQLDYRGLGMRVPCLIISPYAKKHYVSHTRYEFGSILKTAEEIFGIASLGATDVRANDLFDAFDFTQAPRAFVAVPATYSEDFFRAQRPSNKPVDDE